MSTVCHICLSVSSLAKEERSKNSDKDKIKDKIILKLCEKSFVISTGSGYNQ